MKALRSLVRSLLRENVDDRAAESIYIDVVETLSNSKLRQSSVWDLIEAVTSIEPNSKALRLYRILCTLAGVDGEEFLALNSEFVKLTELTMAERTPAISRKIRSVNDAWLVERANVHGAIVALNSDEIEAAVAAHVAKERGEIDWRPAETVPEDYYAL